jgi:hypothetical protein
MAKKIATPPPHKSAWEKFLDELLNRREKPSAENNWSKETDGNYWIVTICIIIILNVSGLLFITGVATITGLIIFSLTLILAYIGSGLNDTYEAVTFLRNGKMTEMPNRYSPIGGPWWKWPFWESVIQYLIGEFEMDLDYKLTTANLSDVKKSKAQLLLAVVRHFVPFLYKVVGKPFTRERMIEKGKAKLTETFEAKVGLATEDLGIVTGSAYQTATKSKDKKLPNKVKKLLVTHENKAFTDCYGFDVRSVNFADPDMDDKPGTPYAIEKAIKASELKLKLSEAEVARWNTFVNLEITNYKNNLKIVGDLNQEQLEYVMELCERKYNDNPNSYYYQGLSKSNNSTILPLKS